MSELINTTEKRKISQISLTVEEKEYLKSKRIRPTHLVREAIAEMMSHDKLNVEFQEKIQEASATMFNRCRADFQGELLELKAEIDDLNETMLEKLAKMSETVAIKADNEDLNLHRNETNVKTAKITAEINDIRLQLVQLKSITLTDIISIRSDMQELDVRTKDIESKQVDTNNKTTSLEKRLGNIESNVRFLIEHNKGKALLGGLFQKHD